MPIVYRGSDKKEDILHPKLNKRVKIVGDKRTIIFNEMSIHATPYKYIALSYTYTKKLILYTRVKY